MDSCVVTVFTETSFSCHSSQKCCVQSEHPPPKKNATKTKEIINLLVFVWECEANMFGGFSDCVVTFKCGEYVQSSPP